MDNDQLVTVATANLALRLNISIEDATNMVAQRWTTHNESTALEAVDSTPAPVVQITAKDLLSSGKHVERLRVLKLHRRRCRELAVDIP